MKAERKSRITTRTVPLLVAVCLAGVPAWAKYSGGVGTAEDPYRIATAGDLILLGESPDDYDKHFVVTADIDLDPNLPGRRVFHRAVIAPNMDPNDPEFDSEYEFEFQGPSFSGVLDGAGHTVSHLTIEGDHYLGLLGRLAPGAQVKNLGVVDVNIIGSGYCHSAGGLLGQNSGRVTRCYSTGTIGRGDLRTGGLVGYNEQGTVVQCYSSAAVSGDYAVGGLVGRNAGRLDQCYSAGVVSGDHSIGGLAGENLGVVTHCYSTAAVTGNGSTAGLVGYNEGDVVRCYSAGAVSGGSDLAGLVANRAEGALHSIWDVETSGRQGSGGGVGLTTAEMMDPYLLGLNGFAGDPNWVLDAGRDYPRLAWQGTAGRIIPEPAIDWLTGQGTAQDPYRIDTADQLIRVGRASILWDRHFVLGADIDLDSKLPGGRVFSQAVIPAFAGVFDGAGHTVSHMAIQGDSYLGLFGRVESAAEVRGLGVLDANVAGSGMADGLLVGRNSGAMMRCYSSGAIAGLRQIGGLVGYNCGAVIECHSAAVAKGDSVIGGLVGDNNAFVKQCYSGGVISGDDGIGGLAGGNNGTLIHCYSTASVSGVNGIGGLAGGNSGSVSQCYSTGPVSGDNRIGGLVGGNSGPVIQCYSTGPVSGRAIVGGLVGRESYKVIVASLWDTQTSGQATSAGGMGMTTAQMQNVQTYLDAGWDFLGEAANGTSEVWSMTQEGGYPVLAVLNGSVPPPLRGSGTAEDPYVIDDANELGAMVYYSPYAHYRLAASIDLSGTHWGTPVVPWFAGTFDGNGLEVLHLTIHSVSYVGLFGQSGPGSEIKNLGLTDVNIVGSRDFVGALVGRTAGNVTGCYSTGAVTGENDVGGVVGYSVAEVADCHSAAAVTGGDRDVGGVLGWGSGRVLNCHSTGGVSGGRAVGGVAGSNEGEVIGCSSTGPVSGIGAGVGGLVGHNSGTVTRSHSTGAVSGGAGSGGVGGLVGGNWHGAVSLSYSTGAVSGAAEYDSVGGLVGYNTEESTVTWCYSTGAVRSPAHDAFVGGLVGRDAYSSVTQCYSTGAVSATGPGSSVGGLLGGVSYTYPSVVTGCFWDMETSGEVKSTEGTGKTTAEMQTIGTYLNAGWDFVDETVNGTEDIWWIDEGKDYPRLWWEALP